MCFFVVWFINKKQLQAMIAVTLGSLVYEVEQIWTKRTFDYMDLIAIITGFLLALIIFKTNEKY